jgi:hypothetical protein
MWKELVLPLMWKFDTLQLSLAGTIFSLGLLYCPSGTQTVRVMPGMLMPMLVDSMEVVTCHCSSAGDSAGAAIRASASSRWFLMVMFPFRRQFVGMAPGGAKTPPL